MTNRRQANLRPNYSNWQNSKTKAIRVPEALAEQVLEYARRLDQGGNNNSPSNLKRALAECKRYKLRGEEVIRVSDLEHYCTTGN